ncbi:MAG TPA: folylpolyglutamate synthase/dihydrofolate synthase family protein [Nitrospirales bacterium]
MAAEFEKSLQYLYALQSHGIKPGLSRTIALLEALGNPHSSFGVFHVAGTNGKGSTAAMIASVLAAQGYRVGLYTSPHLMDFTERIQINGAPLTHDGAAALTEIVRHAAERCLQEPPTFFEATTAMAFRHFAEEAVQFGVIEVGLGGRYDATNVVAPIVTGITTIALDHQQYLGNTLEAIAGEKAGIIKDHIPVVAGRIEAPALAVIQTQALQRDAPCRSLGREFDIQGESPAQFSYRGISHSYAGLMCPLAGRHQMDNAACALAMLEVAQERAIGISDTSVRTGLQSVRWPGRLEIIGWQPRILLDGAHNPQAAAVLATYLAEQNARPSTPAARLILVVGMMRDKDREQVLARLAGIPGASHLILTKAMHPRAAEPEELALAAAGLRIPIELLPSIPAALARARGIAHHDDTICVTGSLAVVGEAKAILENATVSDLRG